MTPLINLSIKNILLWNSFTKFEMCRNNRITDEDIAFSRYVLDIGNGDLSDDGSISECCIIKNTNVIDCTYGDLIRNHLHYELSSSVILSPCNADVNEINKIVVTLLDSRNERMYTSIDSADNCDDNGLMRELFLPEYFNTLNPQSLSPYELHLRIHCIVILITNISIRGSLCNGTRLRILDLTDNILKCKIITDDKAGDIVFINSITLYSDNDYPFTYKRRQFPVRHAFVVTKNKAQGETFSNVFIDLLICGIVFTHAQLYGDISRVRTWNGLEILIGSEKQIIK